MTTEKFALDVAALIEMRKTERNEAKARGDKQTFKKLGPEIDELEKVYRAATRRGIDADGPTREPPPRTRLKKKKKENSNAHEERKNQ